MGGSRRDAEFSVFVRTHRVQLLRTACLLTAGERHLGEDLVQSALARVYVAWPRIRSADAAGAYARRAVVTAFLDETRRAWRRHETSTDSPPETRTGATDFETVEDRVDGHALRVALTDLPPRMRAMVVLRYEVGLSVADTARTLDCAEGTVKSMSAAGLLRLRGRLTECTA